MKTFFHDILICGIILCLSGCSFLHRFQIKNDTDQVWKVEYKINDTRGVFGNRIVIEVDGKKRKIEIEDSNVIISLQPKETASFFARSNAHYDNYKNNVEHNPANPYEDFINIDVLKLSWGENIYELDPTALEKFMDKNKMTKARISTKKILEQLNKTIP